MANNDIDKIITTYYRGVERKESFYEYVARESVNIKSRQDALIAKTTEKIFKRIEEQNLQNNQIIIYKTSYKEEVPKVLTGLVAMKICAKYNKCALVLRPQIIDGVQYYMGSGRGKRADGGSSRPACQGLCRKALPQPEEDPPWHTEVYAKARNR